MSGFPWQALFWSLLLHALVMAAFVPLVPASPQPDLRLHASLRPALAVPAAQALSAPTPAPAARPPVRTVTPTPLAMPTPATAAVPPAPTFATPEESPLPVASARQESAGMEGVPMPVESAQGTEAAGLRQYRLALASEARRFRRYPETARRVGLAGTAEIRVAVDQGRVQAELARSSGHVVLDAAALDMLRKAAERAELPVSLRGLSFAVLLPVSFEMEE